MGIITLFTSILAIFVAFLSFMCTYRWERRRATIEAYKDLQEVLFFLYEYKDEKEIELFVNDTKSEEYKVLSSVLGSIESFAICVQNKTYDQKMVYALAHGYIDVTLRKKITLLLDVKKSKSSEDYYPNTAWLLLWMDQNYKL